MSGDPLGLGEVAKDSISGFEGVIVCVSQWLHGCKRVTLSPVGLHEGKPIDNHTFDEPQLVRVRGKCRHMQTTERGGPRPGPRRAADPK